MVEYIEPQFTIVIFGDGCQARAVKIRTGVLDQEGNEYTEMWLVPSRPMLIYYNIPDSDFSGDYIKRRYPSESIITLNDDPGINTKLVLKDYLGNDTIVSRKYPKVELLKAYRRQIELLKKINARLQKENKLLSTQQQAYIERAAGIIQAAQKARAHVNTSDDEDEGY
jgi:hypothetical protein